MRKRRLIAFSGTLLFAGLVIVLANWRWGYVTWQLRSARALMHLGSSAEVELAITLLHSLLEVEKPDRPELLFQLGRANRRAGNFETGMQFLQQAEAAGWETALVDQQRFLGLLQRGRIDASNPRLRQLLNDSSGDEQAYEVYEALAKGYLFSYRFADAVHCLNFWTDWCPQATDPRIWRAGIWEQTERWEEANAEYREVLRIRPEHTVARLSLARNLMLHLNQADAAYREIQRCLQQSPDDFNVLLAAAACERQLAESERAEQRLVELLTRQLTPQQRASVQQELGQILLDRGELDQAVLLLTEVTAADPQNSAAFYVLGSAYAGSGQHQLATEAFARSQSIREQYGRLSAITTELVSQPARTDLRWEAGRILMEQGLHTEGAAWMATVLMFEPDHQPTHEALAEYYETFKQDPAMARHHRSKLTETAKTHLN